MHDIRTETKEMITPRIEKEWWRGVSREWMFSRRRYEGVIKGRKISKISYNKWLFPVLDEKIDSKTLRMKLMHEMQREAARVRLNKRERLPRFVVCQVSARCTCRYCNAWQRWWLTVNDIVWRKEKKNKNNPCIKQVHLHRNEFCLRNNHCASRSFNCITTWSIQCNFQPLSIIDNNEHLASPVLEEKWDECKQRHYASPFKQNSFMKVRARRTLLLKSMKS